MNAKPFAKIEPGQFFCSTCGHSLGPAREAGFYLCRGQILCGDCRDKNVEACLISDVDGGVDGDTQGTGSPGMSREPSKCERGANKNRVLAP